MNTKFKDEIFNQELFIVALLYFIIIMSGIFGNKLYKIYSLEKELLETKALVIEYYNAEDNALYMVESMNKYTDSLESELSDYKYLENLLKDIRQINGIENREFILSLCISENYTLAPNTNHQGKYEHICGVDPLWKGYLKSIGVKYNTITAGFEVYNFYLTQHKGDKRKALLDFKGVKSNKKVKQIVEELLKLNKKVKK